MAPSIIKSTANPLIPDLHDWNGGIEENYLVRRNSGVNGNSHSTLSAGKIAAIVAPIALLVIGLLIWGIYAYRRRLQSKKIDLLRKVQYPRSLSDKATSDLSSPISQDTFLVALPFKGTTGPEVTVGIGNDKPRVLYVMPGEDPSSAPLKQSNNGIHDIPALKINTASLPPPQNHTHSPSPSPRTAASKMPGRSSMSLSTKSDMPYRLVVVESTFPTSLPDELDIRVGEHLYLIEEYEDEWCLVQRVGSKDKGVIPRLCLLEKDRTPSTKTRNVFRFSAQAIAAAKAARI